ncbi:MULTISPECIES: restriction endonuclease [Hyphobacterium]|uniref:Restriction endonuclease n=1 Tax=Hyphobacterium vulgare TaxID=1736751 RepID=A0ABV6ZWE1_9PROT
MLEDASLTDLIVDAVYKGGRQGNASDDPLPSLLSVSNQGGFRYRGKLTGKMALLCLVTSTQDADWPDALDEETGVFTYFGDNKKPGSSLTGTQRFGNKILELLFENADAESSRSLVPPTFIFERTGNWRDVRFVGLAVPGSAEHSQGEDLVAVWRSRNGRRFQNYRAKFTVLDAAEVSRRWINVLIDGGTDATFAPVAWRKWLELGIRTPLRAPRVVEFRTPDEQMPSSSGDRALLAALVQRFREDPYAFEKCACELVRLHLPRIASLALTRSHQDGGRDGIGTYSIGEGPSSITVDFALEAKCYTPPNSVGTRDVSRLISRLRHRQFGVLVTTTWVARQAYQELKEDRHPIVVVAGGDIVRILRRAGISTVSTLNRWLDSHSRTLQGKI